MHITVKKFFWFLIAAIAVVSLLVVFQFRKALNITVKGHDDPIVSNISFPIPESTTDKVYGNPGAPLTIVEYMDLRDDKSLKLHKTFTDFVAGNPAKARLIWKDFPQKHLFSGDSTLAHAALYCAGLQNKFWEFLNATVEAKATNELALEKVAEKMNFNVALWRDCANSTDAQGYITNLADQAKAQGITVAPTVFINNKKINVNADVDWNQMLTSFIEE